MKPARSRRTTLNPLKFTDAAENCDTNTANLPPQNLKKHKRSMYAAIKRSPSIEKILAENKNKKDKEDSDPQLKKELELIKRRDSIISRQKLAGLSDSPTKNEDTLENNDQTPQNQE